MPTHSDDPHQQPATAPALSRRGFIQGAGGAAAGAALLGDPLLNTARGAEQGNEKPNKKKVHSRVKRPTCIATVTPGSVVTSDDNGRLILWAVKESAILHTTSAAIHTGKAAFVTYSNAIGRALTAGYDGKVILHDVARLDDAKAHKTFTQHVDETHKREVWVVAVSRDGRHAVSAANDGQILLWNPADPTAPAQTFDDHPHAAVGGLAFIPVKDKPSTEFLSSHAEGEVRLWNVNEAKEVKKEFTHDNSRPVNAVAVAGDGSFFISAGFDLTLRKWDLVNRDKTKPDNVLKGHKNWIWRVAISPSGKWAASVGDDGLVLVWRLDGSKPGQTLKPDQTLGPFKDGVMGVTFTAEDRIVFTAEALSVAQPLRVQGI
jgi:WD40 repeat protein